MVRDHSQKTDESVCQFVPLSALSGFKNKLHCRFDPPVFIAYVVPHNFASIEHAFYYKCIQGFK